MAQARRAASSEDVTRLIADRQRLAIAGRLAVGSCTLEELAADCRLEQRDLRRQLPKLVGAGLVNRSGDELSLNAELLREVVAALPRADPISPHLVVGLSAADAELASRYFDGRRLVEIPVGQVRRRVVLGILVDEFEPGRYYSEAEVRRILRKFHPDDAALRRYMVEDGLLSRDSRSRTYWRAPGPAPPPVGADTARR